MERIWWEKVPNAVTFLSDIVENLLSEKSIVLSCSGEFPWYSYMVDVIKDSVTAHSSSKSFFDSPEIDDPGSYLLKKLCKTEKRAEYRPTKTYAKFFASNDDIVIHERYIWAKVSTKSQLDAWTGFVSEYNKERGKGKNRGVFIIECKGIDSVQGKKGIKTISLDDYVNEYDRIVFCTLASASVAERSIMKTYLTELVANVIGNDIELCAACLENHTEFLKDSFAAIQKVVQSQIRNDGTDFNYLQNEDEVKHLVWLAQIKSIYPVLEEYREGFVEKYYSVIKKCLPISSSYGEIYNDPNEVELGTLKFLADNGKILLQTKEYEKLKLYKEARNKLSHLTPLTLDEIKNLLV